MPYNVFLLIIAAVAALAIVDMGLGRLRPDPYAERRQECRTVRLGLREFVTRPLPIFLFGVGAAMLPVNPCSGSGLLLLAGVLALLGPRARKTGASA